VRIEPVPTSIKRDAVSRYVDIGANVSGRSLAAVAADVESRVGSVEVPFEFHIEVLADTLERQAAQRRMLAIAVAAIIGIFLLLEAAFDSWRLAFLTALTLPMAFSGGVLAVLIGGGVLSIGSLYGFYALLGIAVRNSIVLTGHLKHLSTQEEEIPRVDLVLRGAQERFGPIIMTALTTALALLPFLFAGTIAGNEMVVPVAIVVLGGLVTSTLLTLFILPALYLRFVPKVIPAEEEEGEQLAEEPSLGLA
jgi:Cu/Ag efflux pump CusA